MVSEIKNNVKKIRDYFFTAVSCSYCAHTENNSLNQAVDFAVYLDAAGWRTTGGPLPTIECPACVEGWRDE